MVGEEKVERIRQLNAREYQVCTLCQTWDLSAIIIIMHDSLRHCTSKGTLTTTPFIRQGGVSWVKATTSSWTSSNTRGTKGIMLWTTTVLDCSSINRSSPVIRCQDLLLLETYTTREETDLELPDFLSVAKEVTDNPHYSMHYLSVLEDCLPSSWQGRNIVSELV